MILDFRNKLYDNKALDLNQNAEIGYLTQVIFRPNTFYCQKLPFLADNEYSVFVSDLCGNNLQEITDHSYFSLDYIEFASIYDFNADVVIVKIVNDINPQEVWYSNPLLITDCFLSTEIDYKDIPDSYMQSAGVKSYFTRAVQESEVKTYIQETGTKVSSKAIFTEIRKYIFEKVDNFIYRRLNLALGRSIVYLEKIRVTDKPLLKDGDIDGSQNTFRSELTAYINYNDTYLKTLQIAPSLALVNRYPDSIYNISLIENRITLIFNKNVDSVSNSVIALYKDNVFYSYLDLIQINSITFEQAFTFTVIGEYEIRIESGKFISNLYGVTSEMILPFAIREGEYDSNEYDNNEYLV